MYQYKDHLGNVRLSYSDTNGDGFISNPSDRNNPSEIIEESNYYPFGLKHKGYNNVISSNGNSTAQKFKYNGKEFEEVLGLNLYEMDVRMYDPAIGRFNGLDPVVHHSQGTSVAFDNNPIFWADPSGADAEWIGDFGLKFGKCPDGGCNNNPATNIQESVRPVSAVPEQNPDAATASAKATRKIEEKKKKDPFTVFGIKLVGSSHTIKQELVKKEVFNGPLGDKLSLSSSVSTSTGNRGIFNINTTTTVDANGKTIDTKLSYSLNASIGSFKGNVTTSGLGISTSGGFGDYSIGTGFKIDEDLRPTMTTSMSRKVGKTKAKVSVNFKPGGGTVGVVAIALTAAFSGGTSTSLVPGLLGL